MGHPPGQRLSRPAPRCGACRYSFDKEDGPTCPPVASSPLTGHPAADAAAQWSPRSDGPAVRARLVVTETEIAPSPTEPVAQNCCDRRLCCRQCHRLRLPSRYRRCSSYRHCPLRWHRRSPPRSRRVSWRDCVGCCREDETGLSGDIGQRRSGEHERLVERHVRARDQQRRNGGGSCAARGRGTVGRAPRRRGIAASGTSAANDARLHAFLLFLQQGSRPKTNY